MSKENVTELFDTSEVEETDKEKLETGNEEVDNNDSIPVHRAVSVINVEPLDDRVYYGIQKEYPSALSITINDSLHFVYEYTFLLNEGGYTYRSIIGEKIFVKNGYISGFKKYDDNGKEREFDGDTELTSITPFPEIFLPLEDDERIVNLTKLNDREKYNGLYNHLCLVREYYNDIDIRRIADFINLYVFNFPIPQKDIEDIISKAYSIDLKNKEPNKVYKSFDEIEEKETQWLFYPYIPLGAITILAGDPGCGKSNLSVALASIVSNGGKFPFEDDDTIDREPSVVIMQNGEDGIEDVIKPRLVKSGANDKNIGLIVEDKEIFTLSDLKKLELVLEYKKPKLVIFDPIQRYIGNVNINSISEVTDICRNVIRLAQKYSCAILFVMHLNKGQNKGIYKLNGSIGLPGSARSVLMVEELKDTDDKAILHIKSNLAKKGKAIIFEITDNGVVFKGQVSPNKLEFNTGKESKISQKDTAKDFIKEILSGGAVESQVVLDTALNEKQIAKATLERAKSELNVKSFQRNGKWFWVFKDDIETDSDTSENHTSEADNMDI